MSFNELLYSTLNAQEMGREIETIIYFCCSCYVPVVKGIVLKYWAF